MTKSGCPTPARLQAFTLEALPEEQQTALAQHIEECPACRAFAAVLREWEPPPPGGEALGRLRKRLEPHWPATRGGTGRRFWWWFAAPAAVAAAFALGVWLVPRLMEPVAGPPGRVTAWMPAPDYSVLARVRIEKAPVRLPVSDLLIWRGSGAAAPSAEIQELAGALAPYRKGDYEEAAKQLEGVWARYPESYPAAFYLGVSWLLAGRAADAVRALEGARRVADEIAAGEAAWYLAAAHLRSGSFAAARPHLERACLSGTEYAGAACETLRSVHSPQARR